VEQFLGFAIPGVPYGCTYALFAIGLVLTYQATGVFNFAFGAQAFTSAYVFVYMVQNWNLPVWAAFLLSVVVLAPALGLIFNRFIFSRIATTNTTAKIVMGIALLVGIPTLLPVIFGNQNLYNAPSLILSQSTVYFTLAGYPVNGQDLTVVLITAAVLVAVVGLIRFTSLGLQMRATVESRRLAQLNGVNADRVVAVSWTVSSFLAGLSGVLLAPYFPQVQSQAYITLMVAAIAVAACASLRSLPLAALFGVLLGVASFLLQGYLPTQSIFYSSILPSLPFIVLVLALLFNPGLKTLDDNKDPLASVDPPAPPRAAALRAPALRRITQIAWYATLAAFIISMLTWMPRNWENVFNSGLAFATVFLSITLITGMGGQLSLAQGTLAGVGAFTAAQVANHLGLNMVFGMLIGAGAAAVIATVLAVLSLRLKGLGLALMTLAAALFFDSSIFPVHAVSGGQGGTNLQESWVSPLNLFDPSGHQFFILALLVLSFAVVAVLLVRKGTTGRFLAAMRGSELGVGGVGINVTLQRVLVFALSGALAGVGGTLLVLNQQNANPAQFNYQLSLAFVVIVVTVGVTTVEGAIQGAIGFVVIEQLLTYAPARLQGLSFVLFAAGALTYASHPEGVVEYLKRQSILLIQHTPARSETGRRGTVPLAGETGLHPPSIAGIPRRSVTPRTAAGAEHE
jgi:branched-subunit amino acid ABC-type transport system permease component